MQACSSLISPVSCATAGMALALALRVQHSQLTRSLCTQVPTADLWKFLLTAVGVAGTDLVKGYSEAVLEGVAAVCAPEAADASKLTDDYDEAGPAFDDPFDSEDYPVQEGCAQQ